MNVKNENLKKKKEKKKKKKNLIQETQVPIFGFDSKMAFWKTWFTFEGIEMMVLSFNILWNFLF